MVIGTGSSVTIVTLITILILIIYLVIHKRSKTFKFSLPSGQTPGQKQRRISISNLEEAAQSAESDVSILPDVGLDSEENLRMGSPDLNDPKKSHHH